MTRLTYPGVYIDEFSSPKRIEGVSTFILGMLIGIVAAIAFDRSLRCRRHLISRRCDGHGRTS